MAMTSLRWSRDWYRAQGYHFLALSDHNVLHVAETWMSEAAIQKRKKSLGQDDAREVSRPLR